MPEPTHPPFNASDAISASSSLKNKASNGEFDRYRTMNGVSQVPLDASTAARSVTSRETQNAEIARIRGQITTNPTDESATGIEKRMESRTGMSRQNQTKVNSDTPVDLISREAVASEVRTKFNDVFEVNKNKLVCTGFEHMPFEKFSDEVNTVGCFCTDKALAFYRALDASPYILDIIEKGHHPVLSQEVPPFEIKNRPSLNKYIDFALPEILKLIETGRVEVLKEKPKFLNPLHVVDQVVKKRLILDCSHLNSYIEIPHFKYEDYKSALCLFKKHGYMIAYDLKDGYNQLLMHKEFRKYLSFQFQYKGKTVYARYLCGPFGLKDLPYVFTKLFRPLIKHWRACGIPVVQYLDDGWACFLSKAEAILGSEHIRKDLLRFGAIWSIKKCTWEPVKELDWIGFTWNCEKGTFKAREKRLLKVLNSGKELLSLDRVSARKLASFNGQIISMMPVIDDKVMLYTRFSQMAVASAERWDSPIHLDQDIKTEILFWTDNIRVLNLKFVFEVEVPRKTVAVYGDASNSGCGSFISGSNDVAAKLFSPQECKKSSTWRELENVRFSIQSLSPILKNNQVMFFTDSQPAQRILQSGSMKRDCHILARDTLQLCAHNHIDLDIEWIPREDNKEADRISREPEVLDTDDWGVSQEFVHFLESRYDTFTLDIFANDYNKKTARFLSLYHAPGSSGVDAFSFNWENEFNLVVPPVSVIGRALQHFLLCGARGVFIVPCWPSSYFWPMLINDFSDFIVDTLKVKGNRILVQGLNKNSLLGSKDFNGFMLILRLDCSKSV